MGNLNPSMTNGDTSTLQVAINPFISKNFMMGMKSFNMTGLSKFKFQTNEGTTTNVNNSVAYKFLSFSYWSFKLRVCPAGYPYFQLLT